MGVVSLAKGGIINSQKYSSLAAGNSLYIATVTGGVLSSDSTYFYRAFKANGTLAVSGGTINADILVIAGGGSGGSYYGGGGGAGGLLSLTNQSLPVGSYSITVGAGGASSAAGNGGSNSQFGALTAAVGGGRGGQGGGGGAGSATSGGSGGGGGSSTAGSSSLTGGAGTSGQGYAGGNSSGALGSYASAGGGGAGGPGETPPTTTSTGGAGGIGSGAFSSWLSATLLGVGGYIAGGGGGEADSKPAALGGLGGGGNSGTASGGVTQTASIPGVVNTGSGGGGGNIAGDTGGGAGGSGLVIVRYPKATIVPVQPWQTDANSAYLKIATPFNSDLGISDYSANIIGSGISKTTSSVNGAALSTAVYKYYNSSLAMGAYTDNKFISIPRSTDLQIGSNDFTIEGWYYFTSNSVGYQALASHCGDSADQQPGWILILESNNTFAFYSATSAGGWSNNITTSTVPSTNTWHHVAVSRSGTNLRMFLNGTQIGTTTTSTGVIGLPSSRELRIGSYNFFPGGTRGMNGYIQDFRMYIGAAKYTGTFTPPLSIYTGG